MRFARKTKAPKGPFLPGGISNFGRVWEHDDFTLPDGTVVKGHYESYHGMWLYFRIGTQWYKVPLFGPKQPNVSHNGLDMRRWAR